MNTYKFKINAVYVHTKVNELEKVAPTKQTLYVPETL